MAVVVDRENHVLAYVCDGNEDGPTVGVAEWFRGAVADDGSLDLTSEAGAHLVAQVTQDATEGTITLDGEEGVFAAEPVDDPAGLYRKVETVDGEEYVGGWIVLASGEERGAVRNTSTTRPPTPLLTEASATWTGRSSATARSTARSSPATTASSPTSPPQAPTTP